MTEALRWPGATRSGFGGTVHQGLSNLADRAVGVSRPRRQHDESFPSGAAVITEDDPLRLFDDSFTVHGGFHMPQQGHLGVVEAVVGHGETGEALSHGYGIVVEGVGSGGVEVERPAHPGVGG